MPHIKRKFRNAFLSCCHTAQTSLLFQRRLHRFFILKETRQNKAYCCLESCSSSSAESSAFSVKAASISR